MRELVLQWNKGERRKRLVTEAGAWSDDSGARLPPVEGCIDVDLSATPFTNTLPIRRLALDVGASRDVDVAYVETPSLAVRRERQRYVRTGPLTYRFEAEGGAFSREIVVDEAGLVVTYPGLFRRIF